jgi:hypothetical protein
MENNKKGHIYVNSHPRSGSTYFVSLLENRYGFWQKTNDHLLSTIWKEHYPQVLLADIPDTIQISIVRDPIDCLSSSVIKDMGDFITAYKPDRPEFYDLYFKHKIEVYNKYIDNIISNSDNLLAISFESVVSKDASIVEKIDSLTSLVPIKDFKESSDAAERSMKKSNTYTPFHNNYPMFKPPVYAEYKDKIKSYKEDLLKETYQKYNYLKSEVLL